MLYLQEFEVHSKVSYVLRISSWLTMFKIIAVISLPIPSKQPWACSLKAMMLLLTVCRVLEIYR